MADSSPKLTLSIMGKDGIIGIHKNTVNVLGQPRYVSLRVSRNNEVLLLRPCEANDVMSFKTPRNFLKDHHVNFRIYSLKFVKDLLKQNELSSNETYFLDGQYIENENAAIFPLITARLFNPDMEGDDLSEGTES